MSFGLKTGRACGIVAAFAVEGVVRTALAAGEFGRDAAAGAEAGFVQKHSELLVDREQRIADKSAKLKALKARLEAEALAGAVPLPVVAQPAPVGPSSPLPRKVKA